MTFLPIFTAMVISAGVNLVGGMAGYIFIFGVLSVSFAVGLWKRRAILRSIDVTADPDFIWNKLFPLGLFILCVFGVVFVVVRVAERNAETSSYVLIGVALALIAVAYKAVWPKRPKDQRSSRTVRFTVKNWPGNRSSVPSQPNEDTISFCVDGISHPDGDPVITLCARR